MGATASGLIALSASDAETLCASRASTLLGLLLFSAMLGIFVCAFALSRRCSNAVFWVAAASQILGISLSFTTDIGLLWHNVQGCLDMVMGASSLAQVTGLLRDNAAWRDFTRPAGTTSSGQLSWHSQTVAPAAPTEARTVAAPTQPIRSLVEIREMEIADLGGVFALGEHLFTAERWPSLYRTWDQYALATHFASDSETCLVAEIDDKVVGFAVGSILEKPGSAWTYGYLIWLGVDPNGGRRGIGAKLVSHLQDVFIELGARMIMADTDAENTAAISFFESQGFEEDSEHVYLSKNLTYDPDYIAHHRKGRVADRPGGVRGAYRRAHAKKGKGGGNGH